MKTQNTISVWNVLGQLGTCLSR